MSPIVEQVDPPIACARPWPILGHRQWLIRYGQQHGEAPPDHVPAFCHRDGYRLRMSRAVIGTPLLAVGDINSVYQQFWARHRSKLIMGARNALSEQ
ncbi:hypothetical protein AB0L82_39105 [Nocardia sp. NPDC052001]|uniref:hypothetical protein n=1 Tax=Nocardia sp. NPDC052001 TaxID=3154853 RepID=UPI003416A0D5